MKLRQLHVKIGLCSLNNDPLDFKNNYRKIYQSIQECKKQNCSIRVGGQLEVSGYACEDHFLEYDTIFHSWDVIKDLIMSGVTDGIVVDVGCPILHKAALYNGRVIIYNSRVVAVRLKMIMADGGNYFQTRYFSAWKHPRKIDQFMLPQIIQEHTGQHTVPIGCFILSFNDTSIAYEVGEQAWISDNPMIDASLDGAQIFMNPSASEHERGKIQRKLQMFEEFTERHGGAYIHANVKGAVGGRTSYDGLCCFTENGRLKELSQPFHLGDVQVTPVTINLNSVRTFRINNKSFQKQSHGVALIPRVKIDLSIANNSEDYIYDTPEHKEDLKRKRATYSFQHASYEPSAFLWDVLRKSGARGFFLPLSGGLDSCTVTLIVYNMCHLICNQIRNKAHSQELLQKLRKIVKDQTYEPEDAKQLTGKLLFTSYLATQHSSNETKKRSEKVAETFGCSYRCVNFGEIYKKCQGIAKQNYNVEPKFSEEGGSHRMDLALQNIQARTRMVLSYFLASLELEIRNISGFLLVLGSVNLDETLRGYYTKYDCSASDVNPIGSFSKYRLRQIVNYFHGVHEFEVLQEVLYASPSAELRPLQQGQVAQTDQEDMGLTYAELCIFGRLRKVERLGPVSMFDRMVYKDTYEDIEELATKIKRFFTHYAINRHKASTLPPTYYYDPESCDHNRYDMRPFMYATDWSYQFEIIDERVKEYKKTWPAEVNLGDNLRENRHSGKSTRSHRSQRPAYELSINVILPPSQEQTEEMKQIFNP